MLEQGYCLMPNTVLYSKELTDKQKLLYCCISNLCAEKGFCRASNEYIGELLNADKRTISRNLSALQEKGFIFIEDGIQRKITLDKNVHGGRQKCLGGVDKNVYQNNTIEYYKEKKSKKESTSIPSKSELVEVCMNDERINGVFEKADIQLWLDYKERKKQMYVTTQSFIQQLVIARRKITMGQPKLDISKRFNFAVNNAIGKGWDGIHRYEETEREYLATKKDLYPNQNKNE